MNKRFLKVTLSCLSLSLFSQGASAQEAKGHCPTALEVLANMLFINMKDLEFKNTAENMQASFVRGIVYQDLGENALQCQYSIKTKTLKIPEYFTKYRAKVACRENETLSFSKDVLTTKCTEDKSTKDKKHHEDENPCQVYCVPLN